MAKLTRNNIAYDLHHSPYETRIKYKGSVDIRFRFSSELYTDKFHNRLEENRKLITDSLSKRFGFNIKNQVLCDIVLYSKIEKRGFLLFINGVAVECLENITLDGLNPIIKS